MSVDDVAKSITIKDDTGAELKFTYDDKTDVSGAREGVAGLATRAGSKVTVKFKEDAAGKLATKIEVAKAPGASSNYSLVVSICEQRPNSRQVNQDTGVRAHTYARTPVASLNEAACTRRYVNRIHARGREPRRDEGIVGQLAIPLPATTLRRASSAAARSVCPPWRWIVAIDAYRCDSAAASRRRSSGRRFRRGNPSQHVVARLERAAHVAVRGVMVGERHQRVVRLRAHFDLLRRIQLQLAQPRERRIEPLACFGAAPQPPQRIRGTGERPHFVPPEQAVVLDLAEMPKHVIVDVERLRGVDVTQELRERTSGRREQAPAVGVVGVAVRVLVDDREGPPQQGDRLAGSAGTHAAVAGERFAAIDHRQRERPLDSQAPAPGRELGSSVLTAWP